MAPLVRSAGFAAALLLAVGCAGPGIPVSPVVTTGPAAPATSEQALPASSSTSSGAVTSSNPSEDGSEGGFCPAGSEPGCEANSQDGAAYLAAHVVGGTYGFHVVQVGGGLVASLNSAEAFYPASSLKVLVHLHAVRWVTSQPDPAAALETPVPVYDDYCTGAGPAHSEPLSAVLRAMMVVSDNQRADAALDYFGREAVQQTAVAMGLPGTLIAHRFGCGGPANDPANRSTALDLCRIYEQIAGDDLLSPASKDTLSDLMLSAPWPSLSAAVAAAAAEHGLPAAVAEEFLRRLDIVYKAGWWETNLSVAGLLGLPGPCPERPGPRFAFADFVSQADEVVEGFDPLDVVTVAMRSQIETAVLELAGGCG